MTEPLDRTGLDLGNGRPAPGASQQAEYDASTGAPGDGGPGPADGDVEGDDGNRSKAARRARTIVDWAVVVVVALVVAFVVRTFVLAHFVVDGQSMMSTLSNGDRVFVNKLSYRLHDPNRGDVVVLHESQEDMTSRDLIKRVIALPGETIEMRNCVVTIDGNVLEEPYLDDEVVHAGNCGPEIPPYVVPDDHYYVLGDNRAHSQDSRTLRDENGQSPGAIPRGDIVGRAFVVFWPTSNWRWL